MMTMTQKKRRQRKQHHGDRDTGKEDKEENTCRANQEKGLKQYDMMSTAVAQIMIMIMMKMAYTSEQL